MKRKNLGVLLGPCFVSMNFSGQDLESWDPHNPTWDPNTSNTFAESVSANKRHAEKPPSDNAFARKAFDTSETQQPSGTWHQSSRWTSIVYAAAMLCQYGKMEVMNHTSLVSKYVSKKQVVIVVNISQVLPSFPGFKTKEGWVCHVRYFTWVISYKYITI